MKLTDSRSLSPQNAYRFRMVIVASLIAILPVLLVGWMTYSVAKDSLLNEVESFNRMIMKQAQERTDSMFEAVNRTVSQHIWDDQLQIVLKEGQLQGNEYELNQVITTIITMETLIDFTEGAYLYIVKSGALITANGLAEEPGEVLGDSLLEGLKSNKKSYFWHDRIARNGTIAREQIHGLSYAHRIPTSYENPLGYFIVQINEQAIAEIFEHMEFGQTGGVLAVSPEGNIFADKQINSLLQANLKSEQVENLLQFKHTNDGGYSTFITLNNQLMLVHGMHSTQSGWRFMSIVPYQELIGHIQIVKGIVMLSCLILSCIALVAALLLTTNIQGKIRSFMERLQSEKQALEIEVKEALPERRAYLLRKWLTEPLVPEEEAHMGRLGIPMKEHFYTAVSLEWCDYRKYSEQKSYELFLQITDLAQQSIHPFSDRYFIRFGPDLIGAILIQQMGSEQQRREEIMEWAERLLGYISLQLNQSIIIGVGTSVTNTSDLHRSYEEAEKSLHHRMVEEDRCLFLFEAVMQSPAAFSYPFEQEREMIALLKLGEREKAEQALYSFNDKLMSSDSRTREQIIQAYSMLLAAFIRMTTEAGAVSTTDLLPYNVYDRLNSFKMVSYIVQWLRRDIFTALMGYTRSVHESGTILVDQTVIGMLDYVRDHYDEELSLTLLSEVLDVSEAQLSQLFKKEVGLAFSDYIITVRMEKAKELLCSTDIKIVQLAERLTYNNSQNFIRVFKRIVGVTPGEYRKQNKVSEAEEC